MLYRNTVIIFQQMWKCYDQTWCNVPRFLVMTRSDFNGRMFLQMSLCGSSWLFFPLKDSKNEKVVWKWEEKKTVRRHQGKFFIFFRTFLSASFLVWVGLAWGSLYRFGFIWLCLYASFFGGDVMYTSFPCPISPFKVEQKKKSVKMCFLLSFIISCWCDHISFSNCVAFSFSSLWSAYSRKESREV